MAPPPKVFDRSLIAAHLARRPADRDDFVTRLVLDDLAERLLTVVRRFERALIIAPDPAGLPAEGRTAQGSFRFEQLGTVLGPLDPEALTLPRDDYDLIASILDLQVVNDVPGYLARIRAHLAPDGLFLGVALGGDTLVELRAAWLAADADILGGSFARVAPFIPVGEVGGLLQRAGFALPVGDVETHTVRYRGMLELIGDLRSLGATNPLADRPGRPATRQLVARAAAAYDELAGDPDGRIRATLEFIWMSGWAPHESQQKALKPGSAEVSLANVLGRKNAQ